MTDLKSYVDELLANAARASQSLARASTALKDEALRAAGDGLTANAASLKQVNEKDVKSGKAAKLSPAVVDRLALTDKRICGMAEALRTVASLRDPVGEVISGWTRPNGLRIQKVRVPIGVLCVIYESRPNVTADAASLCLKSGNAVILRGGSESIHSNIAIHAIISKAIEASGLDKDSVQLVNTTDRAAVDLLLAAEGKIDLVVARGGEGLIRAVMEKAKMPVLKHYKGVCHTFVDESADLDMAEKVCLNAKLQRPAVCNAMETMLIHSAIAKRFLPAIAKKLSEAHCEMRGCERSMKLVPGMKPATEEDYYTEYGDLILSVKVVDSVEEAIAHITKYGSKHTDAIITENIAAAERFTGEVDSSGVFVNCSTRLNDGGEFGMGAEIGTSTDKLHARGPMGLEELTSYKYIVQGDGQIRT